MAENGETPPSPSSLPTTNDGTRSPVSDTSASSSPLGSSPSIFETPASKMDNDQQGRAQSEVPLHLQDGAYTHWRLPDRLINHPDQWVWANLSPRNETIFVRHAALSIKITNPSEQLQSYPHSHPVLINISKLYRKNNTLPSSQVLLIPSSALDVNKDFLINRALGQGPYTQSQVLNDYYNPVSHDTSPNQLYGKISLDNGERKIIIYEFSHSKDGAPRKWLGTRKTVPVGPGFDYIPLTHNDHVAFSVASFKGSLVSGDMWFGTLLTEDLKSTEGGLALPDPYMKNYTETFFSHTRITRSLPLEILQLEAASLSPTTQTIFIVSDIGQNRLPKTFPQPPSNANPSQNGSPSPPQVILISNEDVIAVFIPMYPPQGCTHSVGK